MSPSISRTPINTGWAFKQSDAQEEPFLPVAQFPTTIHLDLLHHGRIPDPTCDLNSDEIQWVGEKEWTYKTTFEVPTLSGDAVRHFLVFDGLDTHATIQLNGVELGKTENMFHQYRIDVTKHLRSGSNELVLLFSSTFLVGKELEKEQGFKNLFWNGDSSRMNVRKIGCHYGWDWGPTLLTCGPWRPIYLESFKSRISDLGIEAEVANDLDLAIITATVDIDTLGDSKVAAEVRLLDPDGKEIEKKGLSAAGKCIFTVKSPKLWYPVGYGNQPLYTVSTSLQDDLDSSTRRIGLRLSELVQRPLPGKEGTTFFFRVNNIPIFCRGTNWIPPDTFLPRMTPQRYRDWLELAVSGNQNMIRIWGGGLYEDDVFYNICDELGILIWHDFMLGCGSYPLNDQLLASIEAEAKYNLRRIRHHPCIVLWCGNNEDHMFAELHHLEYDMNDKDPQSWLKTNWPARYYYEKLLKDICEELVPGTPYHFSSPYGGSYSNDQTVGDMHSWRVWMADQPRYPYQEYELLTGRFVSEYGMKSYPSIRTLNQLITDPAQRHPQSKTLDSWHMAPEDQRTLALYLIDNFRHGNSLDAYAYATQVLQSEAMSFAVRAFRRPWRGPGKEECAGSLIWQLNDCFPAASWSLADNFMRPKLVFYTTTRDYAPIIVGASRRTKDTPKDEFTKVYITHEPHVDIWASNLTLEPVTADLEISFIAVKGGVEIEKSSRSVTLLPNRSAELFAIPFPSKEAAKGVPTEEMVVSARLLSTAKTGSDVIARFIDWPQPLRHLDLSKANIAIKMLGASSSSARYSVSVDGSIAKAVELTIDTDDNEVADSVVFSDNCLELVPQDERAVEVTLKENSKIKVPDGGWKIKARHLGTYGYDE